MEATLDQTAEQQANAKEENDRASIALQVPIELKTLADAKADASNLSTAAWVRSLVARECDYVIPADFGTRSKYGSDEERKAAIKAKNQKRNQLMNMLLKKYRAGEIDLNSLLEDDDDE